MSAFVIETASFRGVCRSSCRLPSLPLKPSPSSELFVTVIYSVVRRFILDTQLVKICLCFNGYSGFLIFGDFIGCPRFKFDCAGTVSDRLALLGTSSLQGKRISKVEFLKSRKGVVKLKVHFEVPTEKATLIPHSPSVSIDWAGRSPTFHPFSLLRELRSVMEVVELYGCEKSLLVVEAHRPLSGLHSINLSALERSERFYELTQATPEQAVDDEAVYYNVAGECPRGRVYGIGLLGRKKRRYADPGASTSQMPEMVPRSEFDNVTEQLRQVVAFMQRQFWMTMDGAGLS
ncbi:hypothetical protein Scep_019346 [Stephania cephalantha]|uniref:Uncharacterized protein n=1 Tax=Stephania cephalantha TaxID=152367 RepID=A0AAP0IB58_9MAGN